MAACYRLKDDRLKVVFADGTSILYEFIEGGALATFDYDPNQERDPEGTGTGGQWSSGGATASAGHAEASKQATSVVADVSKKYPGMGKVEVTSSAALADYAFAIAGNGKVLLNEKHFTPEGIASREKEWNGLVVDASLEGTIVHELGHVYMKALREEHGQAVIDEIVERHAGVELNYDNFKVGQTKSVSAFAMENPSEFEAESFCAFHYGRAAGDNEIYASALKSAQAMWEELTAL